MNEIKFSRSFLKTTLLILGCLLFITVGYWLFTTNEQIRHSSPFFRKVIGVVSILFGATGVFLGLKILFNNNPSLIVNQNGVILNHTNTEYTLIKWEDINQIGTTQIKHSGVIPVKSTKFILLFVKNPKSYINKSKRLKKVLLKQNLEMYGTPFCISSVSLQCSFDELEHEIRSGLERYRSSN